MASVLSAIAMFDLPPLSGSAMNAHSETIKTSVLCVAGRYDFRPPVPLSNGSSGTLTLCREFQMLSTALNAHV
jgi:hypothetical protein